MTNCTQRNFTKSCKIGLQLKFRFEVITTKLSSFSDNKNCGIYICNSFSKPQIISGPNIYQQGFSFQAMAWYQVQVHTFIYFQPVLEAFSLYLRTFSFQVSLHPCIRAHFFWDTQYLHIVKLPVPPLAFLGIQCSSSSSAKLQSLHWVHGKLLGHIHKTSICQVRLIARQVEAPAITLAIAQKCINNLLLYPLTTKIANPDWNCVCPMSKRGFYV